ncbi:hypothetical protein [Sphingomonas sp.]|nr:hypothetical protein [Sphingomonas sp.]MBX9795983.1 hypothetical protein [Sphingomonas sp.]
MLKLLKSPLVWQLGGGFMLGTLGLVLVEPAAAAGVAHDVLRIAMVR